VDGLLDDREQLPHRLQHDTLGPMATYIGLVKVIFRFEDKMSDEEMVLFFRHLEETENKIKDRNARFTGLINRVQEILNLMVTDPAAALEKRLELNKIMKKINERTR